MVWHASGGHVLTVPVPANMPMSEFLTGAQEILGRLQNYALHVVQPVLPQAQNLVAQGDQLVLGSEPFDASYRDMRMRQF